MGEGLIRLQLKTGEIKNYKTAENAITDRKVNSLVNDYISKMSLSPDGKRVYLATTMGVCCLDIATESWTKVFGVNTINYGTPIRVVKEYDNKLWIGTNNGLYSYNLANKELRHMNMEKGLADNGIASIQQGKQGMIWLGTDHGLCRYNPKTKLTQSFFVDNGLQSNEFSDGASSVSPNGTMIFGGVGGVTWFNPSDIKQTEWKADVKLTAFSINGELVTPETKSGWYHVTDTTLSLPKDLH